MTDSVARAAQEMLYTAAGTLPIWRWSVVAVLLVFVIACVWFFAEMYE